MEAVAILTSAHVVWADLQRNLLAAAAFFLNSRIFFEKKSTNKNKNNMKQKGHSNFIYFFGLPSHSNQFCKVDLNLI